MNILNLKKDITQILKIIILALILSAGVSFIYAQTSWFPPGVGPSYQINQNDPLNEGPFFQQKDSGLILFGYPLGLLVTNNNVGIGPFEIIDSQGNFDVPEAKLHIKAGIEECSGTPNSCNVYDGDGLACEAAGCTVSLVYGYPNCIGTPISCPNLDQAACASSGCLWTAGGIEATQTQGGLLVAGEPGVAMDNDEITVQTTIGSPSPPLYIQNDGGNTIFNLAAGNVGLGVDPPLNKLHVSHGIYAINWIGAGCEAGEGSCDAIIYGSGANAGKIQSSKLAHGVAGKQKRVCVDGSGFLMLCEDKYDLSNTIFPGTGPCRIPLDVEYAIIELWGGGGGGVSFSGGSYGPVNGGTGAPGNGSGGAGGDGGSILNPQWKGGDGGDGGSDPSNQRIGGGGDDGVGCGSGGGGGGGGYKNNHTGGGGGDGSNGCIKITY